MTDPGFLQIELPRITRVQNDTFFHLRGGGGARGTHPNLFIPSFSSPPPPHKIKSKKIIFRFDTLNPHGINERFSFNLFIRVLHVTMFSPVA